MKPLRVAVIGAGYWGPNLVRNLNEAPGAEPVAVADLSQDRLDAIRKRFPAVAVTTDHRALFADPSIDAVCIATPVHTHRPLAEEAFAAGKHVFVEKPLGVTVRDLARIRRAVESSGVVLACGHTARRLAGVRQLKREIDGRHIGTVTSVEAVYGNDRGLTIQPGNWRADPPPYAAAGPAKALTRDVVPTEESMGYDIRAVIDGVIDEDSFFEIKPLFAPELVTGFGLLEGQVVGIVANQPAVKGGVLFVDSADKAARFINLCDAFNIPLIFLADVPGFMIGTKVERQGIIRHGAKLVAAVSEATVPKISVVVRKAYGAGLYAMAGPAFGTDVTIALPTAQIAVMGPEAAVNAVYYNRIQELEGDERRAFIADKQKEYQEDIDIRRLASELIVDEVIEPEDLRLELVRRLALYENKNREFSRRRHPVTPV